MTEGKENDMEREEKATERKNIVGYGIEMYNRNIFLEFSIRD